MNQHPHLSSSIIILRLFFLFTIHIPFSFGSSASSVPANSFPPLVLPIHSFTNFTKFTFNPSSPPVQTLFFSLNNYSDNSLLNISLTTPRIGSGIVISALLCSANGHSTNTGPSSSPLSSSPTQPILFGSSLAYESVLIQPGKLPQGLCDINASQNNNILELLLHSVAPENEGTIAVRWEMGKEEEEEDENGHSTIEEDKLEGKLEMKENKELMINGSEHVLDLLNGPIGTEFGEMERFQIDLSIRQGHAQLSLVQECPTRSSNQSSQFNKLIFLLGNFSEGHFTKLMAGTASEPYERIFNIRMMMANKTDENMTLDCAWPLSDSAFDEDGPANNSDSLLQDLTAMANQTQSFLPFAPRLFISIVPIWPNQNQSQNPSSSTKTISPILSYTISRTFRPILVVENAAADDDQHHWGLSLFFLLGLVSPLIFLALIAFFSIVAHNFLVHQKMDEYEAQRKSALGQQLGYFEINMNARNRIVAAAAAIPMTDVPTRKKEDGVNKTGGGSQRRRIQPVEGGSVRNGKRTTQIDVQALCQNALGEDGKEQNQQQGCGWI